MRGERELQRVSAPCVLAVMVLRLSCFPGEKNLIEPRGGGGATEMCARLYVLLTPELSVAQRAANSPLRHAALADICGDDAQRHPESRTTCPTYQKISRASCGGAKVTRERDKRQDKRAGHQTNRGRWSGTLEGWTPQDCVHEKHSALAIMRSCATHGVLVRGSGTDGDGKRDGGQEQVWEDEEMQKYCSGKTCKRSARGGVNVHQNIEAT